MKSEKKIQAEHLMKNDIVLEGPILTCRKPFEAFASLIFFLTHPVCMEAFFDLSVGLFYRSICLLMILQLLSSVTF